MLPTIFLPKICLPQNIFFLEIVATREKNWLATLSSGVGNTLANEIVANQFFAKKYFFFLWQQFREKKYFVAKKLVGNTLIGGWQHSRRGLTMMPTTSIGTQFGMHQQINPSLPQPSHVVDRIGSRS